MLAAMVRAFFVHLWLVLTARHDGRGLARPASPLTLLLLALTVALIAATEYLANGPAAVPREILAGVAGFAVCALIVPQALCGPGIVGAFTGVAGLAAALVTGLRRGGVLATLPFVPGPVPLPARAPDWATPRPGLTGAAACAG